jgi:hypothetical protein
MVGFHYKGYQDARSAKHKKCGLINLNCRKINFSVNDAKMMWGSASGCSWVGKAEFCGYIHIVCNFDVSLLLPTTRNSPSAENTYSTA